MSNKPRRDEYSGGFPDGFESFEKLKDPRNGRHPRHYFGEIIFIALPAMICGSEGFDDFERFAKAREPWLRKRLKLPGGLPSDDTFRRVFTAIDGKTLRHSFENADPGTSLHLISAWASDNHLTLGQLAVDGKPNEITAVPEFIDRLDLEGQTVSLDVMGCQKAIARKLSMAHADYLLALKANHGALHKRAEEFFSSPGHLLHTRQQGGTLSTDDQGNEAHGRTERRVVLATDSLRWIDKLERDGSEAKSVEKRYYLTTHEPDARRLGQLIRQHGWIENPCHWVLDVTFDEDQCRASKGHPTQNLAMLRKVCLSLLKQDTRIKDSLRGKRYRAALDESVLETILFPKRSK